jgi:hypothetical protein
VRRVDRWEGSIKVRGCGGKMPPKNDHDKLKIKGQQLKKVYCGAMWVNVG